MKKLLQRFLYIGLILLSTESIYAQIVKGVVKSSDKDELLPGVSITVKGTTVGTTTNANGEFSLKIAKPNSGSAVIMVLSTP